MPNPLMIMAGLQAVGSLIGGISAMNTGKLNAYNIETERMASNAQAKERSRMRMDEYKSNLSANLANFAAQGRDVSESMSVKAFLDKQKEIAADDVSSVANDAFRRSLKYKAEAAAEISTGRAKMVRSLFDAGGSIYGGIYRTQQTET